MCPGSRKVNQRPKLTDAPAIVLPTPTTQSTRKTILEIDNLRSGRPDATLRRSILINTVIKLHKDGIIERIVILRLATYPQTIPNTRLRRELHLRKCSR